MVGMEPAVHRIASALLNSEKILVFGDYDVDGITATTLVHEFLSGCGAHVSCYIPHRINEGYGLQPFHIREVAAEQGIRLLITVDCGSGSAEAVTEASRCGIDTIITDHHFISEPPPALAVVNPRRCDCTAGTTCLSGVGVAFFLLVCLRRHLREIRFWAEGEEPNLKACCDLVALGTVADIVPLIDENRVLTRAGLDILNTCPRPGIRALIEASGLKKPFLTAEDLAFRLAPRLNAAGRMAHARQAVELLATKDPEQAQKLAASINQLNTSRQTIENQIFRRICMHLEEEPELLDRRTLVLAGKNWHEGILGIVASRLAQQFWRPVVLLAVDEAQARGSARSIPGLNLYDAIAACSEVLENYGGHPMAAGLRLHPEKLEAFRRAFDRAVSEMTRPDDFEPFFTIDAAIELSMISEKLADELAALEPFGPQNEEPLFFAENVDVVKAIPVGGAHRRLILRQGGQRNGRSVEGIWFNAPEAALACSRFADLVFRLRWNYWNGSRRVQLVIADGSPA
jgi:single-stranded-DNA-specific exonuclease